MSDLRVRIPFTPRSFQRAAYALSLTTRFLVLVWHRRAGKTVFAVLRLLLAALACERERGRFAYIAPQLKQAKTVAWDYVTHFARFIPGAVVNESELSVDLPNGAQVRLYGADNPDGLRGIYLDGMVADEVAQMKAAIWGEILRPALSDRTGWAMFIGTPKGVNLFSQLYYGASSGNEKWVGWAADLRRSSETHAVPEHELQDARNTMSVAEFAQEYECDFNAAVPNCLLSVSDVTDAMARSCTLAEFTYAPKILGVDVARYGDDLNCILGRQGVVAYQPKAFGGLDTMNVAGQVCMAIDNFQPSATFIDVGGIGAGVLDRCLQLGKKVVPVNFGGSPFDPRYANKRAEMWWAMADWVRDGGCLPNVQRLQLDLTAPRYDYANAKGKHALESKDDMKARGLPSTDYGDALACTFAFPVGQPDEYGRTPEGRVQTDYSVFGEQSASVSMPGTGAPYALGPQPAFVSTAYDPFGGA